MSSVAVCVASHERPGRLAALLDALAAQERPADEVVVAFDDRGEDTARLLADHPLAPRAVRLPPGQPPGVQRNAAWRAAEAQVIAFTDDDCRPEPRWVAALADAAAPGAVVQGRTIPDPDEADLLRARLARSQAITPPDPRGQACNIAYPRALLSRLGGFSDARGGEDADLLHRALAAGAQLRPAPGAVVRHAVHVRTLRRALADGARWADVAGAVRANPSLRVALTAGVFLSPAHAALVGAATATAILRRPVALAAWIPWVAVGRDRYGRTARGRARALGDVPLRLVVEGAEVAACLRGSLRHRTVLL